MLLRYRPVLILTVLALSASIVLSGCTSIVSRDAAEAPSPRSTPTPTLESLPSGAGAPSELESSIALVRPAGEADRVLGSAVVMSSDGTLVTSRVVAEGDVEVVLPNGEVHRPVLVSTEPETGLATLKVPAERLVPIRFSTARLGAGSDVYASGYDGSPDSIGRISGTVVDTHEEPGDVAYRVRGPMRIDTDISMPEGFTGGALTDEGGAFSGVLIPGEDEDGSRTVNAVSNWFILAWMEERRTALDSMAEDAEAWDRVRLPGDWEIGLPAGWSTDVASADDASYHGEFIPGDPDASIQVSISVEPNEYGTDPEQFIQQVYAANSGARLWGVTQREGCPLVRLTTSQEGALVDVAYLLDEEYLVAVSMTSGFQPDSDQVQADQARMMFETVIGTLTHS